MKSNEQPKGSHGVQNVYMTPLQGQDYGTPIEVKGARDLTRTQEQESTTFYADNRAFLSVKGTVKQSGEYTGYYIPDEILTTFLGMYKNASGALTDGNPQAEKNGAISYVKLLTDTNGNEFFQINVIYDCTFGKPSEQAKTDEEGVELIEETIPYTGKPSTFVKDDLGNLISYFRFVMPKNSTEEDVIKLLSKSVPRPTDTLPQFTPAVGTFGTPKEPTATTVGGKYSYTANDDLISGAKIAIFAATDLNTEISKIEVTTGTDIDFNFTNLTANTAYTIKMLQDGRELATIDATTKAAK